ncbi:unnamed protein product, partial [Ilex paraguariensis]
MEKESRKQDSEIVAVLDISDNKTDVEKIEKDLALNLNLLVCKLLKSANDEKLVQ